MQILGLKIFIDMPGMNNLLCNMTDIFKRFDLVYGLVVTTTTVTTVSFLDESGIRRLGNSQPWARSLL